MPCDSGPSRGQITIDINQYIEKYTKEIDESLKVNHILKEEIDRLTNLLCISCSKLEVSVLHQNKPLLGWYSDHLKRVDSYADDLSRRLHAVEEMKRLNI